MLILACASICAVACKQKTSSTENQQQIDLQDNETDMKLCQSCGMPLSADLYGSNSDGSPNDEYCKYCYVDGNFTMPEATMSEMIEICVPFMVEQGMTEEDACKMMEELLPTLKRWKEQ
jgi:hypothetical protein